MAVSLKALSHHAPVEDVQGGKQRCRPIPFVVVRHRSATPLLHRQSRLRAVQLRKDFGFAADLSRTEKPRHAPKMDGLNDQLQRESCRNC